MKNVLLFSAAAILTTSAYAQIEVDKSIQMTGGSGDRIISNLELPVNGTDAANKDYVDTSVSASGGSGLPTMISDESASAMNFGAALRYCKALTQGSFSDWRLPDFSSLTDALSIGGVTVSNNMSVNYIWFKLMPYGSTSAMLGAFRISDGEINGLSIGDLTATLHVRCIR